MSKIQRSWQLLKRSSGVISENKRLLIFPLLSLPCLVVILLFFFAPMALKDTGHPYSSVEHWTAATESAFTTYFNLGALKTNHLTQFFRPVAYPTILAAYLVSMFVTTFLNVALYSQILNALNGRPVSIAGGFGLAFSQIKQIAAWSLFAGIIGAAIKAIEDSLDGVGRWVIGLIGTTWSVAAVFAIPVLVRSGKSVNPLQYLRISATALKKTWGEGLAGYLGIRAAGLVLGVFSVIFVALAFGLAAFFDNAWIVFIGLGLWLLSFILATFLLQLVEHVYRAALYLYAVEGVIPERFNQDELDAAWTIKPRAS